MSTKWFQVNSWNQWGEIMGDVVLFISTITDVCLKHKLKYWQLKSGFPGTHAVFLLDNNVAIKFCAPLQDIQFNFELEFIVHSTLIENGKISKLFIPQLIAFDSLICQNELCQYAIMKCINQENCIVWRDINVDISTMKCLNNILRQLSSFLDEIHQLPIKHAIEKNLAMKQEKALSNLKELNWAQWVKHHRLNMIDILSKNEKNENKDFDMILNNDKLRNNFIQFYKNDANFSWYLTKIDKIDTRLVHGDLTEDHIYISNQLSNLSHIIDFGDSRIAPIEYEWIALHLDAFQRNIKVINQFWDIYYQFDQTSLNKNDLSCIIVKPSMIDKVCLSGKVIKSDIETIINSTIDNESSKNNKFAIMAGKELVCVCNNVQNINCSDNCAIVADLIQDTVKMTKFLLTRRCMIMTLLHEFGLQAINIIIKEELIKNGQTKLLAKTCDVYELLLALWS